MGRAAYLVGALALAACVKQPPMLFGARMPSGCTEKTRTERCYGWMMDRLMMTVAYKPYHDDAIRAYVATVGARIARANNDSRRWTYRVLDDDTAQAYAGFNSTIYITRGALAILRDEAELAAILGHEMGHTLSGHHRESIAEGSRDVGETDLQRWKDLRHARDDEIQADELAVILLARAGYDVHAVERMLRALGGGDQEDDEDASDQRHPVWRERIARVAALAARYPEGERFVDRYNERVAKLVVGDDPRSIAVVGTTIMFARAGFALDLPADTKWFIWQNMVVFGTPDESVAGIVTLIDRDMADESKKAAKDTHTEVKLLADAAVTITVIRDEKKPRNLVALAKALVAQSRAPRPEEVARLRPMRFDPTKPRAIWAR
ncbi:MAG: M48 family metallopeptidase [Myxococcota bacterium]|nr:M48 family metalloprotease [Deltaproteobacteria bacterium]MDQ3341516.1 M48 family metallopeptidase [Myxococcota bacterium]